MTPRRTSLAGDRRAWPAVRRRCLLALAAVGAALLPASYLALVALADPVLTVRDEPARADVIVVLGGDGPSRAAEAARQFRLGAAPEVLVTGDADCLPIRDLLVTDGVPAAAIALECRSRTTWENALYSAEILRSGGGLGLRNGPPRSGILVTSWFHSLRALACFGAAMPEILWLSAPTRPQAPWWQIATTHEGVQAAKEYLKLAWYAVRGHIGPLASRVGSSPRGT